MICFLKILVYMLLFYTSSSLDLMILILEILSISLLKSETGIQPWITAVHNIRTMFQIEYCIYIMYTQERMNYFYQLLVTKDKFRHRTMLHNETYLNRWESFLIQIQSIKEAPKKSSLKLKRICNLLQLWCIWPPHNNLH